MLLLFLFLTTSLLVYSQQYDNLYIEKSKVDKNNIIYMIGTTFTYTINISDNGKDYYISKANKDSLTINKSAALKEINLEVIKPKIFNRTNKHQTEILYRDKLNPTFIVHTGLVENKENIWFHPPRMGYLRALETCPFPYIKLTKSGNNEWTDEMVIGNHWADKRWGAWEGSLLLKYQYKIVGKKILKTPFGDLECIKIYSTATSDIGQTSLTSYFNAKYGFVKLKYTLFSGTKIDLTLQDTNKNTTLPACRL